MKFRQTIARLQNASKELVGRSRFFCAQVAYAGFVRGLPKAIGPGITSIVDATSNTESLLDTLNHNLALGIPNQIVVYVFSGREAVLKIKNDLPLPLQTCVRFFEHHEKFSVNTAFNAIMNFVLRGRWVVRVKSGQFLFFPLWETRSIRDFLDFVDSERRFSVYATWIEAYSPESSRFTPESTSTGKWYFDKIGYKQIWDPKLESYLLFGGPSLVLSQSVDRSSTNSSSSVCMIKSRGRSYFKGTGSFVYPHKLNHPCSQWHISPTVCLVSSKFFRQLCSDGTTPKVGFGKCFGPHSQLLEADSSCLINAGLMNRGQWF